MKKLLSFAYACLIAQVTFCNAAAGGSDQWPTFNGDDMAQRYSSAEQITPENVSRLSVAWKIHTGDYSQGGPSAKIAKTAWSSTPLFVNNTLYVGTPYSRVFSVQPDTGKINWIFDPKADLSKLSVVKSRGMAYWRAPVPVVGLPCQKILYVGAEDAKLHAIDADTGKHCTAFGENGVLNVNQWNTINPKFPFLLRQPPAVFGNTLIIGWAGVDWKYENSPPGTVFGVDAQTGKLKWTFQAIPQEMRARIGTANVWASMSVDTKAGIVYLPVSSPEANFYGGDRKAPIPFGTSITALDATTGKVIWSRQLVHHDLWDYDTDSAPTLVDIQKDGHVIPALVQSSKQGFIYVLNRWTGKPVYPMLERPVPGSDVPGEKAAPTQPYVPVPAPTIGDRFPGISAIADLVSLGYCSRTYAKLRDDGKFTPPSLKGSIAYPGTVGGVEWGGGAVDPVTQTYVVNSSSVAQIYQLVTRAKYQAALRRGVRLGSPQFGTPYAAHNQVFLNPFGMPCWNPPYGTLSSYDLKSGKLLWRKPFGQIQKWGFYMPESWGSVTIGPPIITKSGLIFIGASMDSRVRAIDLKTGNVAWKSLVDAPVTSTPATYIFKGKQYVVFAAGGNSILMPKVSDELVAFALPDRVLQR